MVLRQYNILSLKIIVMPYQLIKEINQLDIDSLNSPYGIDPVQIPGTIFYNKMQVLMAELIPKLRQFPSESPLEYIAEGLEEDFDLSYDRCMQIAMKIKGL